MTYLATTKISPQWSTAVPKEARPFLKADKGDEIEWLLDDGKVVVRKK